MIFDFSLLRGYLSLFLLITAVLSSAIAVVYSKHQSRTEFMVLQKLHQQRDQLNEQWERLLLEQSTWAGPTRVERQAKIELDMVMPDAEKTRMVRP